MVVLAHGFAAEGDDYAVLAHDLAAAGFVVVAPEFPSSSHALAGEPQRVDVTEQARDVSFLLDALQDPARQPAQLAGHLRDGAAVVGHSDGGTTAALIAYADCCADPRIRAAVVMSGAETGADTTWFTKQSPALLAIHGDADEVNPFGASAQLYQDASSPKWLIGVVGGSHAEPFTGATESFGVPALVADFLTAMLNGDSSAAARLATLSGPDEDDLNIAAHD